MLDIKSSYDVDDEQFAFSTDCDLCVCMLKIRLLFPTNSKTKMISRRHTIQWDHPLQNPGVTARDPGGVGGVVPGFAKNYTRRTSTE